MLTLEIKINSKFNSNKTNFDEIFVFLIFCLLFFCKGGHKKLCHRLYSCGQSQFFGFPKAGPKRVESWLIFFLTSSLPSVFMYYKQTIYLQDPEPIQINANLEMMSSIELL